MNSSIWCVGCLVWVAVVSCQLSSAKTCADLEFTDSKVTGNVKVEENDFANLTFHLNTSACGNLSDFFRIKVSYDHDGFIVDVCNLILPQGKICKTTDLTEFCKCLHKNTNLIRFYKKMNSSYPTVYTWTWIRAADKSEDKRKITFEVLTFEPSTVVDSQTATQEAYTTAAFETATTVASFLASERRTDKNIDGIHDKIDDGTLHTSPAVRAETTNVTTRTATLHTDSPRNIANVNLEVVAIQSVMSAVGTGIPIAIVIVIVIVVVVYRRRRGRMRAPTTQRRLVTSELRLTRLLNRVISRDQKPIASPRPTYTLQTPQRPLSATSTSGVYVDLNDYTDIKDLTLYETPVSNDGQGETTYTLLEQKDSLEQKKEKSKDSDKNQTIMSKQSYNPSSFEEPKPGCSKTSDFLDEYVKRLF